MLRRFFSKGKPHQQNITILKPDKPFRTSVEVFYTALAKWEKDNDPLAPVWLNYGTPEAAQEGLKELRREHQLSNIQALGAVIVVSGEDGRRLISAIKRLKSTYHLEKKAYESIRQYFKKPQKRGNLIPIEYPLEADAIAAKRVFGHRYRMFDVLRQDNTLLLTEENARYFLKLHPL